MRKAATCILVSLLVLSGSTVLNINLLPRVNAPIPRVQNDAYIYKTNEDEYFFNSSAAGFLWYWEEDYPGISGFSGGQFRSHSNYAYNLKTTYGYAVVYWEYENGITDKRVTIGDVDPTQTILRNASDFSLVRFDFHTPEMNHTLYYGFWRDKPYIWVYMERTMNRDMVAHNSQTCNMLSKDFQKFWWTDYTGQIQNWNYTGVQYRYVQPMFSALDSGVMDRFPFTALYNNIADVTVGFIYLGATANIRKDTHLWGWEVYPSYNFTEVQVDWGGETDGGRRYWRNGTVMGLEYLVFVKPGLPSSSGNVIDYSRSLYNNLTSVVDDVDSGMWSAAHQRARAGDPASAAYPVGVCGHTVYTASNIGRQPRTYYIPYMDQIPLTKEDDLDEIYYNVPLYSKWLFRRDATHTIELDNQVTGESVHDTSCGTESGIGMIGWDKGQFTAYSHVKAFRDSDKLLFYGDVFLDTEASCLNSSFILYYNRVDDCVKISDTEYDIRSIDPLFGWSGLYLKVSNGTIQEYADRLEIVLFNYSSPQSRPAGTSYSYNFTLWGHTGNRTSMTDFYTKQPLTYRRLFQNYALGDKAFGFESMKEYMVINSTYSPNHLVAYMMNFTSGQKTVEIFIGNGAVPIDVLVNDSPVTFDYNSTSNIVSFNVTFSDVAKIELILTSFSLTLDAGWNMVSFPVIPSNASFSSIFSGVGFYQVLTWDGSSYVTPSTAEAGYGYWVLVLSATTVSIEGVPVESYERDLPAGWSMIGSIHETTRDADPVFPEYYQLLTWDGSSYVESTTIEPGKGYWILVLTPTHIIV